jgi:NitT/TauT family transport system substrate-binding protein
MKIFSILSLALCSLNLLAAPVKVGSSPVISSAGIYLAQERNYFKQEGLEVEVNDFNSSGGQMTLLLSKGELDVGAGNLTSGLFNAIAKGQKFKLVADKGHLEKGKDYIGLLVRTDHITSGRYKSLKDLKGFKMGLTALDGVSQQIIAERFLEKAGLKSSDVEFVKLSYPEMNVALKSKNIDATIQLEPYLSKAKIDGYATNVASAVEVHPHQQSAAIFFSPNFMEKRNADAKKFLIAYLKGIRDYNNAISGKAEKNKMIADLKKYIKIDDDKVWNNMFPIGLTNDGSINSDALMEDVNWYHSKKYLERPLKIEEIVDTSLVKEAAAELNKRE